MPIQGFRRFRKHQVGRQTVIGTPVAATRRLPYSGAITNNPNWTDDEADVGSIDQVVAPYRIAPELGGTWTGQLAYNDLPWLYHGALKDAPAPVGAGTAKTWTFQVASLTADAVGLFTDEWLDDVTADAFQAFGGTIQQLSLEGPDNLGPFGVNATVLFAGVHYGADKVGTVPTPGLGVDANPVRVFMADTELFIDDTFAGLGGTKFVDALHSTTLTVGYEIDQKRFANGSTTRFQLSGYGRGTRQIELAMTFAKTADVLGEIDNLLADEAVDRFVRLKSTSTIMAEAAIPYSNQIDMPARLYTRADGERGQNTTITLVARANLNEDAGYAFKAETVNTLAAV